MKVLSFPHGEVRFCDCIEGMKELGDKSWDPCFTDPPYNIDFSSEYDLDSVAYVDDIPDYRDFCVKWFAGATRACNGLAFTPGMSNLFFWIRHEMPPYQLRFWYKPNACGYDLIEPFLLYGKVPNVSRLRRCFVFAKETARKGFAHPTIKQHDAWSYCIEKLRPESVLDPFIGSGTTARSCEEFGIPWLGFEIEERYARDIEMNVAAGIASFAARQAEGRQKALF